MSEIKNCPECGKPFMQYMLTCNPPIHVLECYGCGWRKEEKEMTKQKDDIESTSQCTLFVDEDDAIMYQAKGTNIKKAMKEYIQKMYGNHIPLFNKVLSKLDENDTELIIATYNKWFPDFAIQKVYFVGSVYDAKDAKQ